MEKIYAFDVDGTLTDARQKIDPKFNEFFLEFAKRHLVYLVTGSDQSKIAEQLPPETLDACYGLFACSAAELWASNRLIYRKEHTFPNALIEAVEHLIDCSSYHNRFGNHVEHRSGMLNISTVGRNASQAQRHEYFEWDRANGERRDFMKALKSQFPEYELSAGGEISIDIVPYGWTKAVAKTEIELRHSGCSITFFGDRMGPGGNDKPLADALAGDAHHEAISVESYRDTWQFLEELTYRRAA